MKNNVMRNLHVPVPDHIHIRLRQQSRRTGRPATALARAAIELWLEKCEREELDAQIAAYATRVAGTDDDLEPALESAARDELLAALDGPEPDGQQDGAAQDGQDDSQEQDGPPARETPR